MLKYTADDVCVVSGGVQMVKCCKMIQKTGVLQKYLSDEQKQLEALNALQELAAHLELNGECLSFVYGLGPRYPSSFKSTHVTKDLQGELRESCRMKYETLRTRYKNTPSFCEETQVHSTYQHHCWSGTVKYLF